MKEPLWDYIFQKVFLFKKIVKRLDIYVYICIYFLKFVHREWFFYR